MLALGAKKQASMNLSITKKSMKTSILHAFRVLHGLAIKRTHTYSWAMRNISYQLKISRILI